MKRTYQNVTKPSTLSSRAHAEFLSKDGQLLLPLVELVERGEKAIDEVIDVLGRATVEAVLRMSAEQRAGPKLPGRRADDRDVIERDLELLAPPRERCMVPRLKIGLHHGEDRPQETLRLAQRQVEDESRSVRAVSMETSEYFLGPPGRPDRPGLQASTMFHRATSATDESREKESCRLSSLRRSFGSSGACVLRGDGSSRKLRIPVKLNADSAQRERGFRRR